MTKRYSVSTTKQLDGRKVFVVIDNKTNKSEEYFYKQSSAEKLRDRLNKFENAYPSGFNKVMK